MWRFSSLLLSLITNACHNADANRNHSRYINLSKTILIMRKLIALLPAVLLAFVVLGQQDKSKQASPTADTSKTAAPKKVGITDKVKSSKKAEGLFTMYQDTATGSIQMYVKKNQLNKEYIYQSFSINGP